jgi:hypothetical protein
MEPFLDDSARQPPASSFTDLPLELRDMIYNLLIEEALVSTSPPLSGLPQWQTPTFSRAHKFDLQISTKRVTHPNLHLPSNLIYTCHQINAEMNTLICSRIHHLKLTGDFTMGLSSTEAIFDILERRPWIANATRTVNIVLKLDYVLSFFRGVAVKSSVLEQHPWLGKRLKIAELKVKTFEMGECGMAWRPYGFWQVLRAPGSKLNWCLEALGLKSRPEQKTGEEEEAVEAGQEHNTLPDLAKLFEAFPLLEKIDIETEHRHLLSLFPAPKDTAESFLKLDERGVEVNVLVKHWQMQSFSNMLYRNGMEKGTIRFGNGRNESGKVALSYETLPQQGHCIVSFRLVDCVLRRESKAGDEDNSGLRLWRWKQLGGMWPWRKKQGDVREAEDDVTSTNNTLEDDLDEPRSSSS